MGRPKLNIDAHRVLELAQQGCTIVEIAATFGCCEDTIHKRFSVQVERGRKMCDAALRSKQVQKAISGDTQMLIWLGKQRLGQRDKHEVETNWPDKLGYGGLDVPERETGLGTTDKPN